MKIPIFIFISTLCAITSAVFVPPRPGHKKPILGQKECTRGPTYWCQNLTAASGCHAVKHCIQTVWVYKQLPPDNSSVCQICLDMVKQARDQLESNETQELIEKVFEGSCALLHLKPVVEECDKIADQYIPELIDTLASEMNPQVVCSVAGLCNNAKVHQLLEEAGENVNKGAIKRNTCNDCHTVVDIVESKFNKMSRDEVLQGFLEFCGKLGSFSDGCSNIIITYFEQIYSHLQNHLNSNEVCLMSGECSSLFHKHTTNVEITPLSHVGYIPVKKINGPEEDDDLPCDLCEQLVNHLREVLVANTTQTEFKEILDGLCKQTGKFTQECLSLVDQYYSEIYNYFVEELQPKGFCILIGICHPVNGTKIGPIAPLLPSESAKLASKLTQVGKAPLVHVPLHKDKATVRVTPSTVSQNQEDLQQLPIDLLMGPHTQIVYNKELCEFCQYFLHFVQEAITEPKTEEKIKEAIDKACSLLPNTVNSTCITFVDTYEPALVALLAQEMDPSQICPLIRVCPAANNKDVEIFMESKGNSKCPLCLFAVSKLESMIKDQKTEENIKNALDKVCLYLPNDMVEECKDFIQTYTDELVEMLIKDLNPEEICVYLKLCSDSRPASTLPPYVDRRVGGIVETNIIPDNTVNGKPAEENSVRKAEMQCVLCEFVMTEIDDALKDNKTDDEIEQAVRSVCNIMPKSVKTQCNDFINQYGNTVIQLLISALEPSDICSYLKLCNSKIQQMKAEILECPVCQLAVETMEKILSNPKVDHKIEHVLEKTCRGLPTQYKNKCVDIINKYGNTMIEMLVHYTDKDFVCQKIGYCKSTLYDVVID